MIPDKIDIMILHEIYDAYQNKKEVNNWDMACKFSKILDDDDVARVYRRIKARMEKYCVMGIFFTTKNSEGKPEFNMNLDKVTFKKAKCSDGVKMGIWFRV